MHYVPGRAVVESSLYVLTDVSVVVAIAQSNEGFAVVVRKQDHSESLHIHYHRISHLELRTMIRSVYVPVVICSVDIFK